MLSVFRHYNRYPITFAPLLLIILLSFPPSDANAEGLTQTVQVVAVIEPELSLTIEPETGSKIDFGTIRSASYEERLSDLVRVNVRIDSNLGHPYQVTQHLIQPMANVEGISLPSGHLMSEAFEGMSAVTTEPTTLLVSDSFGRSSAKSIAYQLRVPPSQSAGTYRGTLMMTVIAQ